MLFNSWDFWIFFPIVYVAYIVCRQKDVQNFLLVLASFYFYGAWSWKFLLLLVFSAVVDYSVGLALGHVSSRPARKALLICSLVANLSLLGVFKYYNFFAENLADLLSRLGLETEITRLNIVLPVGISFYTFQTMSYTIDVYRQQLKPTRRIIDFLLYVSFFPQLVAGPIERATHFLPQISNPRTILPHMLTSGVWLMFSGMYKKVVIADNLAPLVDAVYANSATVSFGMAYLGTLAFAFQIYCDFSGYSDIARGTARVMGFDLMRNFNLPYFAGSPSDFWKRWHISLSTWLRDYLYIPLGGSRHGLWHTRRNLMITMLLGGLWHGASWNFVIWGAFHGIALVLFRQEKQGASAQSWGIGWLLQTLGMFQVTLFGWMLFRSTRTLDGNDDSLRQIRELCTSIFNGVGLNHESWCVLYTIGFFVLPLVVMEIVEYWRRDHYFVLRSAAYVRVAVYAFMLVMWLIYARQSGSEFIYFQF